MSFDYPKLRWPLELNFEQVGDREILVIRDPVGFSQTPLLLVPEVAPIIGSLQGELSFEQIVEKFTPFGASKELILEIVTLLDQHLFLASPRFYTFEKNAKETFLQMESRPAALAGVSYPLHREHLEEVLAAYLSSSSKQCSVKSKEMVALITPHIDYNRGGSCYGSTYDYLRGQDHDLYILIGTAHQYSQNIFHLTKKHFESPLGTLPCDSAFVEKLADLYGSKKSFADEFLHKNEHSLELQIPFLQHLENERIGKKTRDTEIVPILIGSFHEMLVGSKTPHDFDEYESFAGALAECIQERVSEGRKICFVAGVDMAHVGQAFGDEGRLSPEFMAEIDSKDRAYIEAIGQSNKEKLFEHIAKDQNARKICGYPSLYTMMDVLERLGVRYEAKLFDYSQAVNYQTDCAVTFAGMGLYEVEF